MALRRTPSAARRSGDDYQDLVAARAMLAFLKSPSRYRWIKLEAREAGKLDDVVVLHTDDTVEATQVKFSTDVLRAGDAWTWKYLLHQGNEGKSPSLIQQWWDSVVKLDQAYGKAEPRLFSNRMAGDDLLLTATGHIDLDKTNHDVLEEIKSQLGDDAADFIKRFRFMTNEQGLPDLQEDLQREFQSLRLPETNWPGFLEAIRSWIRCENLPPNGELRISDIRRACGWTRLAALTQDLEVPPDYVVADKELHEELVKRITDGSEAVTVLTAGPGIGKSTCLSQLVGELQDSGWPVVRHHYSLGPGRDRLERVEAHRIAESLMAELQANLRAYLTGTDTTNPDPAQDLRGWLEHVGQTVSEEGKHLVVVIDGLDHVWRSKDSRDELTKLFDQLLPVPDGVVLVVGTQPVENQQLPVSLLTYAPRNLWIELPPLGEQAVEEWLDHHHNLMPATWFEDNRRWHLRELAKSLHQRTGGHPLLIRYIVERIAGAEEYLTASVVEAIPEPPANSVQQHYQALWSNVPQFAKDVMFLLAIARFRWPLSGLYEALQMAGYDQANAATGVEAVRHLLRSDRIGCQPFHNSVVLFALEQPEFHSRESAMYQAAITWLEEKAPPYLRRSQLWLLQREAGDPKPLMDGTDRQWVVNSIAAGDPLSEVANVLQAAAYEAIKCRDYRKYMDRGILADVVEHSAPIQYDAVRWILEAGLSMAGGEELAAREMTRLSELNDACVASLGFYFCGQGDATETENCFEQIRRRINGESDGFEMWDEHRTRPETLSELAGLIGFDADRFVRFINQFSSDTARVSLVERWTVGLRHCGRRDLAIDALKGPTGTASKRCLSRYLAVDSVSEGIRLRDAEAEILVSPYRSVYQMFREPSATTPLPEDPDLPEEERGLEIDKYQKDIALYVHDQFYCWLVPELQTPGHARQWTAPANTQPWLKSALEALAVGAEEIAAQWHRTGTVAVTAGYMASSSLDYPPFRHPFTDRESADGVKQALRTITEDLLIFRRETGGNATLDWEEVQALAGHRFAGYRAVVEWIAEGIFSAEDDVVSELCDLVDAKLATTVDPFGERATELAMLATICAQHNLPAKAQGYLHQAAENLIGYGYHKDILLDTTLNVMDAVGEHLDPRQSVWAKLAPLIGAVLDFTDGDETKHLASKLGRLMFRLDPNLASTYLTFLMDKEQYWDVQQVLEELVSTGDLSDPDVQALVSTCIDPDAIELLERRADEPDQQAAEILALTPGYSSRLSRRNVERSIRGSSGEDTNDWTPADGVSPEKCLEYPPEDLDEFIRREGSHVPYWLSETLCTWLCCWAETGRAEDAVEAVRSYLLDGDRFRVSNEAIRAVKQIVGRTRSYDWLVKANRSNRGWQEHSTDIDEARELWRWLKHDFPDRQHEFLMASIPPLPGFSWHFGLTAARLVEYLAFFDDWDDACAVARQLVETVTGLACGQQLAVPSWIDMDGEGQ